MFEILNIFCSIGVVCSIYPCVMDHFLYQAILEGNIEQALYRTCENLLEEKCTQLEETWVRMLSNVGEKIHRHADACLFYVLVHELDLLLHRESIPVKEALQYTAKLLLCYQRPIMKQTSIQKKSLQKLRSNVIDCFPSDAKLSSSGKHRFKTLLPQEQTEERPFVERILAGLAKIIDEKRRDDLREGLEYLSRKRIKLYTIPLLKTQYAGYDTDDMVPFIWGVLRHMYILSYISKLEYLYFWNYKNSVKVHRLGFLVAIAYLDETCSTTTMPVWNDVEYTLLQRVLEWSLDLWKEAKVAKMQKRDVAPVQPSFPEFIPKKVPVPITFYQPVLAEEDLPRKTVHIKQKGLKKSTVLSAKKDEVSSHETKLKNETNRNSARNRGFDFSETWPRIQDGFAPKGSG